MHDEVILQETKSLKRKLDHYEDLNADYLPQELRELRNYIFQAHATFEKSMHAILGHRYIKNDVTDEQAENLFAFMTFASKMRMVDSIDPNFPIAGAKALNSLRNEFAHMPGSQLRSRYFSNKKILRKFRSLSRYYDLLDAYWIEQAGVSKDKVAEIVASNNKKFIGN